MCKELRSYHELGCELVEKGRFWEALQIFYRLVKMDPENSDLHQIISHINEVLHAEASM